MTRIKSFLATVLMLAAGITVMGLGVMMAMAALVVGLMVTLAARLAINVARNRAAQNIPDAEVAGCSDPIPAAAV